MIRVVISVKQGVVGWLGRSFHYIIEAGIGITNLVDKCHNLKTSISRVWQRTWTAKSLADGPKQVEIGRLSVRRPECPL